MPKPEEAQHHDETNRNPEATATDAASSESPLKPELSVSPNSIEGFFLQALRLPTAADQEAFLDINCQSDPESRKRVLALLRAHADAGDFLENPAVERPTNDKISLGFLKPIEKEGVLGCIGPYEVLEAIGRGGMGVVLRAMDPKLNRIVAVKALLPELASNPNSRRRFLREAQAAAAISHPHVVSIHAVDDSDHDHSGTPVPPFLVMECIVGQSLQQKLDKVGPLRLTEILRISRQISDGLAAAHKQGLVHRDIKPANILLENGVERVKITDFGLARAIDDITVTRTGEVCGTPQYMSPEQACGDRVDHRSDLFSLGCVMYAMCTGHSPFRGDSIAHVIKRVTQDEPRSIADQNPEIPLWLIEIINSLLQKKAERRFQSAEDLAVILDQHLLRIQHPSESGSHTAINQQVSAIGSMGSLKFGEITTPVPLEAALHYTTVKSIGRAWMLLTLGGVVLSLVLYPSLSLATNATQLISQAFQYPATMLGIWIMSLLGTKIFTPGVPFRTWTMMSSTMLGCMAFGYFWTTVARMPFSGNLNEISSRTLMGVAIIPTLIFLLYCSWVYLELIKNPETLRAVRNLTSPQTRLSNRALLVLVASVLLVMGFVSLLFKLDSLSNAKQPVLPTVVEVPNVAKSAIDSDGNVAVELPTDKQNSNAQSDAAPKLNIHSDKDRLQGVWRVVRTSPVPQGLDQRMIPDNAIVAISGYNYLIFANGKIASHTTFGIQSTPKFTTIIFTGPGASKMTTLVQFDGDDKFTMQAAADKAEFERIAHLPLTPDELKRIEEDPNTVMLLDTVKMVVEFEKAGQVPTTPGLTAMKDAAMQSESRKKLRDIGRALHDYENAHKKFPAAHSEERVIDGSKLTVARSWRVAILPYMNQMKLYEQFHLDEDWDSEHNFKLLDQMPEVFQAPGASKESTETPFLAIVGSQTVISKSGTKMRDITDGTANTIMLMETKKWVPWTKPEDIDFELDGEIPKLEPVYEGELDVGFGFHVAFADNSIKFIKSYTSQKDLRAFFTRSGDEKTALPR